LINWFFEARTWRSKDDRLMTKQLLHLVIGGELTDLQGTEFTDLSKVDIVGVYPDYDAAYNAWKSAAQRTVDSAQTRYFIVHLHKLFNPEDGETATEA